MKDELNGVVGVKEHDPWAPDPHSKQVFWDIVVECLVRVHRLDALSARRDADSHRSRIESPPPGISGELIYNDEPFYVACDIAGYPDSNSKNRKMAEYRNIYETIVRQVRPECDPFPSARANSLGDIQSG